MKSFKLILFAMILALPFAAVSANAQVAVGVGVGPEVVQAPVDYGPPVCDWGYYSYYPYACAPYGYYGPNWFSGGIFIGAGPWYGWGWRHGWGGATVADTAIAAVMDIAAGTDTAADTLAAIAAGTQVVDIAVAMRLEAELLPRAFSGGGAVADTQAAAMQRRWRIPRRRWRRLPWRRRRTPVRLRIHILQSPAASAVGLLYSAARSHVASFEFGQLVSISPRTQCLILRDRIAESGAKPDIRWEVRLLGDTRGADGRRKRIGQERNPRLAPMPVPLRDDRRH